MSSRFVSAGSFAVEAGTALSAPAAATSTTSGAAPPLASTISSAKGESTPAGDSASKTQPPPSSISPPPHGQPASTLSSTIPPTSTSPTSASSNPPSAQISESTTTTTTTTNTPLDPKSLAWKKVEAQIAAERQAKQAASKQQNTEAEPSLYAVLQANKAAKQAAFDEAHKIKNQFRALDDDEIDFLDEVLQKKREEEERIRVEMERGLEEFRRRASLKKENVGGDKEGEGDEDGQDEIEMLGAFEHVGRKRRRKGHGEADGKGGSLKKMFVKRKTSSVGEEEETKMKVDENPPEGPGVAKPIAAAAVSATVASTATTTTTTAKSGVSGGGGLGGLVSYGSSDEDDD